jgi:hypothetical protein
MYNPLEPWNAWFALSSQAARVCWATQAGMLRGITQAGAKAETEIDRMVTKNVGAAEAKIPAAARKSNKKHRVARRIGGAKELKAAVTTRCVTHFADHPCRIHARQIESFQNSLTHA